ncbi:MAG: hypothetical protein LQ350_008316 [Teloschistes chrysophthalmus]|nr:MAG: hypothetical protein LQ350_008316 [Niorma chrysophthalma]
MVNFVEVRHFWDLVQCHRIRERPVKPKIRHQNPNMNERGVKPAPPLPLYLPASALDSDTFNTPRNVPEPKQPKEKEQRQVAIYKNREKDERLPASRIPEPSRGRLNRFALRNRHADTADEAKRPIDDTDSLTYVGTKRIKTIVPRATKRHGYMARSEPSRRLARISHQQMHRIRRLGKGGEGYCDLFELNKPPRSLIAVKTLLKKPHTQHTVVRSNGDTKPREVYILQDILRPHPRILHLLDYTYAPGLRTKLYNEYCPLNTLMEVVDNYDIHNARIPEGFIWHTLTHLAEALAYIHLGHSTDPSSPSIAKSDHFTPILHRDIKPENVFLRPSSSSTSSPYPDVVLADFGLATFTEETSEDAHYGVGTLSYQPPEVPHHTPRSDIWSLGSTIHTLIHGHEAIVWPIPANLTEAEWERDPGCRRVISCREKGYSESLWRAMQGVMEWDVEERVGSEELVEWVRWWREEWVVECGGVVEMEGLGRWAFEGAGERR